MDLGFRVQTALEVEAEREATEASRFKATSTFRLLRSRFPQRQAQVVAAEDKAASEVTATTPEQA